MLDNRLRMLVTTVHKLYRRGARVNVQRVLVKTHTADIAEVIEHLETGENLEVFRLEPSLERRAEILSYLKDETQKELLYMMGNEEAQDLISRMESDDAADLLGKLPQDLSNKILKMMEREDSEEVTDLMGYPEDSAGGLMSSDFLSLPQDLTVAQAIQEIQSLDDDSLIMFYVYVTGENDQLVGVLSLKQLLLAKPGKLLKDIGNPDVISVTLQTDQQEVAKIVERYDFLAIPVVDDSQRLMGVITVDDVIDVIREEAAEELIAMGRAGWDATGSVFEHIKARLPWLLLTFAGGAVCFLLIRWFVDEGFVRETGIWWYAAATLPLMLALGATAGSQAVSIALGMLKEDGQNVPVLPHLFKEFRIGLPLSLLFGSLVFLIGYLTVGNSPYSLLIAGAVALHVSISIHLGALMPLALARVKIDPTIGSIPLYTVLSDVFAVFVLFGLSKIIFGAF